MPSGDQDSSQLPSASDDRRGIVYFVATFTLSVATLAVGLRIYARKTLINQLGLDDYCAVVALFLIFGCNFAVAWNTNYGLGRHVTAIPVEWIPLYLRAFYVSIAIYNGALMSIKMTFLAQYYRIFQRSTHSSRLVFSVVAGVVFCWAASQLLVAIFVCHPIEGFWDSTIDAVCIPNHPFWEINAAGNIVTDAAIFVMPIPVLGKLNLPRRQKYILMAIFSLGLFTVGISIVRIRYLKQAEDFTWENVESSGWSMGELASGLTCACLPTLRPVISRYSSWMSNSPREGKYNSPRTPGNAQSYERRQHDQELGGFRNHRRSGSSKHPLRSGGSSGGRSKPSTFGDNSLFSTATITNGGSVHHLENGNSSSDEIAGQRATLDHRQRELQWTQGAAHMVEVAVPPPSAAWPLPKGGIQVKRDVLQTDERIHW